MHGVVLTSLLWYILTSKTHTYTHIVSINCWFIYWPAPATSQVGIPPHGNGVVWQTKKGTHIASEGFHNNWWVHGESLRGFIWYILTSKTSIFIYSNCWHRFACFFLFKASPICPSPHGTWWVVMQGRKSIASEVFQNAWWVHGTGIWSSSCCISQHLRHPSMMLKLFKRIGSFLSEPAK